LPSVISVSTTMQATPSHSSIFGRDFMDLRGDADPA
jgi:hypothetical protein